MASSHRLDIGDAVQEGWLAFCRAPWSFTGFAALLMGLQLLLLPLQDRLPDTGADGPGASGLDWLLGLAGVGLSLLVSLWGNVGMVRGAARALAGERPPLGVMLRWEPRVLQRVLLTTLTLSVVLLLALLLATSAGLLAAGLLWLVEQPLKLLGGSLAALPGLLLGLLLLTLLAGLGALLVYVGVNQQLLIQIVVNEGPGPLASLRRGRELVDPQWILMLLLALIELGLLLVGLLTMVVGVLVAWPVVTCISTAAYHQLRVVSARKPSTPTIASSS